MVSPLVSVILPFRNPGPGFRKAIGSILVQEGVSWELILVNNHSDPVSSAIALEYAGSDPRVKIVVEPEAGIAGALNKGIKLATGTFIARMDADDESLPDRLRMQSRYLLNHPQVGLVSGKVVYSGPAENTAGMRSYVEQINSLVTGEEIYRHRFVESPFAHPSVMYRKELIEKFGGYTTDEVPEDYELWLKWFSKGVTMEKVPAEVIIWHDHETRASRTLPNYTAPAFDRVRLTYLALHLRQNNPERPVFVWGGGKLSRKKAAVLTDFGVPVKGFIDVAANRKISGFETINYLDLPLPGEVFVISMVSNRGKYREIDQFLKSKGYRSEVDYILAS